MEKTYDFSGWATKNNLLCSDGRIIKKNAFINDDGRTVPLVWSHQHNNPELVLGHALLKNHEDGVRVFGYLNDSKNGQIAKVLLEHGDVNALSICANKLKQNGPEVVHGVINEVSLVLAGANPGAYIDEIVAHSDDSDFEAEIFTGEEIELNHSIEGGKEVETLEHADKKEDSKEKTIGDIFDTLNEEQKTVVYAIVGQAIEDAKAGKIDDDEEDEEDSEGGNKEMKQNVFEGRDAQNDEKVLMHQAMNEIIGDAKRFGSMKESFLQHADTYGIDSIDYLFPDAKTITNKPEFIKRDTGWVTKVMSSVHHTPFSRIKSVFADITEEDARAKGYIKGKMKKDEVFGLLKRTTTPTTVYKKQKMDRDDVIDITDFDVIAWLKSEMRLMLDEELARAYLVGDGRPASSDDKINEQNIRPIWTDDDLYSIKVGFETTTTDDDTIAKAAIRATIKARKDYKGSGNPVLFTTEDNLINCLLLTDEMGRDLYESTEKLAQKLRVREIVTVPVMEGLTRTVDSKKHELWGIVVNLADYNVGADKGGAINMFDDFDIDYNQQKYLIETRCSGALIKPFSAMVIERVSNAG